MHTASSFDNLLGTKTILVEHHIPLCHCQQPFANWLQNTQISLQASSCLGAADQSLGLSEWGFSNQQLSTSSTSLVSCSKNQIYQCARFIRNIVLWTYE